MSEQRSQGEAGRLRVELNERARRYADEHGLACDVSPSGVVLFNRAPTPGEVVAGNFEPTSWARIAASPSWAARVRKLHNRKPKTIARVVYETDSSSSSDALLLSVFCHPGIEDVFGMLGWPPEVPDFGVGGAVPKVEDGVVVADRSELDLVIRGNRGAIEVIAEAKLTEGDFISKPRGEVGRYLHVGDVFDLDALTDAGVVRHYQLIRNVLAARYHGARFVLLHDARRPDLAAAFDEAHGAIRDPALATRCSRRTWQELAAVAPAALVEFLDSRYGIVPGNKPSDPIGQSQFPVAEEDADHAWREV